MTADPICRPLGVAEAEDFRRLRLEALDLHPRAFGALAGEERALGLEVFAERIRGRQPGDAVFGAFVDGRLVGIAGLQRAEGASRCHRAMLQTVHVQPAHRGTGLAEALVRAVVAHARDHVDQINAFVAAENGRACAFYRRLGFVATGVQRKMLKFPDGFSDEVVLVLDLTQAAAERQA
jgi:ribosomal protein S18 acetylase RimI-like enzyme